MPPTNVQAHEGEGTQTRGRSRYNAMGPRSVYRAIAHETVLRVLHCPAIFLLGQPGSKTAAVCTLPSAIGCRRCIVLLFATAFSRFRDLARIVRWAGKEPDGPRCVVEGRRHWRLG